MNQWMYDTIVELIKKGAPTLADTLIGGLQKLVSEYQSNKEEIDKLKAQIEEVEGQASKKDNTEESD